MNSTGSTAWSLPWKNMINCQNEIYKNTIEIWCDKYSREREHCESTDTRQFSLSLHSKVIFHLDLEGWIWISQKNNFCKWAFSVSVSLQKLCYIMEARNISQVIWDKDRGVFESEHGEKVWYQMGRSYIGIHSGVEPKKC